MTSMIPILKDIIPLIHPDPVQVVKANELSPTTGQTGGMFRQAAIVDKSKHLCASVMTALPHTSSQIHHHGEQDTIVYARSGHGAILSNNGQTRQDLSPGDFALIPAWSEHQEINESDEEVTWIITRSGGSPVVVNLEGWGGSTVKT